MSRSPPDGAANATERVRASVYFSLAYAVLILAPHLFVHSFPQALSRAIDAIFVGAYNSIGIGFVSIGAVIIAFCFYWLKFTNLILYGAIEVVIAQLTIATAILDLGSQGSKTLTILQIFGGIYINIEGIDNIENGVAKSQSRVLKYLWTDYFASDIIGPRILFFILTGIAIMIIEYSPLLFIIALFLVSFLQDHVLQRRKNRRSSPGGT